MRLLTIHQPWAWLIVSGHKRYENRTWQTSYRGPLLIHAGQSTLSMQAGLRLCQHFGIALPPRFDFGAVVGLVDLTNCIHVDGIHDPFATGPFCFCLEHPIAFKSPIAWRGALGLVSPCEELLQAVSREAANQSA